MAEAVETLSPETATSFPGSMPNYAENTEFCPQCQGDLIGPPEDQACGTCGLRKNDIYVPAMAAQLDPPKPEEFARHERKHRSKRG